MDSFNKLSLFFFQILRKLISELVDHLICVFGEPLVYVGIRNRRFFLRMVAQVFGDHFPKAFHSWYLIQQGWPRSVGQEAGVFK